MSKYFKKIKEFINWINHLDEEEREYILFCFEHNSIFTLQDESFNNVKLLTNNILDISIESDDREILIRKMVKAGLEEKVAEIIVEFIDEFSEIKINSEYVANMNPQLFKELMEFVIKNVLIYKEYKYIPFKKYVARFEFNNSNEAGKALNFIYSHIMDIASNQISLSTMRTLLERQYDLSSELSNIFITKVEENLSDIKHSYLLSKINKIYDIIEEQFDTDDINEENEE